MTQIAEIPVNDWLPDRPSYQNPGCEIADNVLPTPGGFGPLKALSQQSGTFSSGVKGAAQFFASDGASVIVGGTDGALFTRRSSVVETSGLASLGVGERWDFCRFNDFVIATSVNNAPQYLTDIDTDNAWTALPGSPPVAKHCARVLDFVMLGNIADASSRIQWSAFNNPSGAWTTDRLTQASFADLDPAGGPVQRIIGGRYATVFQRRRISRLSYVGPPRVWNADVISEDRGTIAPYSVVNVGYFTYFLAQDGFFVTNGSAVEPIGTRRVNKWFFDNADAAKVSRVQGAVDWENRTVVWAFSEAAASDFDRFLIYSWEENRWSTGTINTQTLVSSPLDGTTLEELDATYPDLDAMPLSLDDSSFAARSRVLSAFAADDDGATRYYNFSGAPLVATWKTGQFQPSPGKRVFVSEVTPIIDAGSWDCTVSLAMRDNRNALTNTTTKTTGRDGFAPVRGEGKLAALTITKPSGIWEDMSAAQVKFRMAGER